MYALHLHTHLLHHLYAILESKGYALLCRTQHVAAMVQVEVQSVQAAPWSVVLEHALSPIAKGQYGKPVGTDGHRGGYIVHLIIGYCRRQDVASQPRVQYARAIDAEEHAETSMLHGVVDVCKGVHTRLGVVSHITQYAIHHARGPCRRSNLSRLKHAQRQRIVGLVTRTVGHGYSCRKPQFIGCGRRHLPLYAEGGAQRRNHRGVKAIVIHHVGRQAVLHKIPADTLRQSRHRGTRLARESHGNVVARQHHLIYLRIQLRLMLLYPCQLRRGEVAR